MAEGEKLGTIQQITVAVRKWIPNPRRWWKSLDHTSRQILMVLFGVAAALSMPALLSGDWTGLLLNLGTEFAGGAVTFILLDEILGGSRRKAELKAQLIREMGSPDNGIALRAVNELRAHGWLMDGSLRETKLENCNLKGAEMWAARLDGALLSKANLENAGLAGATLAKAGLFDANLKGAFLDRTNLQGAFLSGANLQDAILGGTKLQGADLEDANLQDVVLVIEMVYWDNVQRKSETRETLEAEFDETTILPDGTNWISDTNMERFTDPKHPDFWRSDNPINPAYHGK